MGLYQLKISGHNYRVVFLPRSEVGSTGALYPRRNVIAIANDQCHTQAASTILHEAMHAMLDVSGLCFGLKGKQEEQFIRALEPFFYQFIVDNPEFIKFLQARNTVPKKKKKKTKVKVKKGSY